MAFNRRHRSFLSTARPRRRSRRWRGTPVCRCGTDSPTNGAPLRPCATSHEEVVKRMHTIKAVLVATLGG